MGASWQSGRREVREDEKTEMRSHELNLTWGVCDARHAQDLLEAKTSDLAFVSYWVRHFVWRRDSVAHPSRG